MKLSIRVSGSPCRDGTTTTGSTEFQLNEFDADAESRLHQAARQCVDAVSGRATTSTSVERQAAGQSCPQDGSHNGDTNPRLATAKQVAAIRAIARRKGVDLDPVLQDRFGLEDISALTIRQASSLIGELKESQNAA